MGASQCAASGAYWNPFRPPEGVSASMSKSSDLGWWPGEGWQPCNCLRIPKARRFQERRMPGNPLVRFDERRVGRTRKVSPSLLLYWLNWPFSANLLQELLHQTDQVLLIERSGTVGAGVEETPHLLVVLQGIENQLLFDDVLVEQFLVERADRALQGVGDAEVFGGDQFPGSRKRHLEDTPAHVDLHQVDLVLLKGAGAVSRRIQFHLRARQQPVDRTYEIGADGVEVCRSEERRVGKECRSR